MLACATSPPAACRLVDLDQRVRDAAGDGGRQPSGGTGLKANQRSPSTIIRDTNSPAGGVDASRNCLVINSARAALAAYAYDLVRQAMFVIESSVLYCTLEGSPLMTSQ